MKKINELKLVELENLGLDAFYSESYTLDALNHDSVNICGLDYYQGDVLKVVDPIAFHQIELEFQDNLYQDEAIEETKDGEFVWVQDVDLDELELELNE